MGKVEITKAVDPKYGNCVKMTNGLVELLVTVDFGPRVISCARAGMENLFFNDPEDSYLGEPYEVYEGRHLQLRGGHRLWISPEVNPRCYYPDTEPVICNPIPNGMEFVAPVEKVNNIQKIIEITLVEDEPSVVLNHRIQNCGNWDIELAPWCITMMDKGGKEVMPQPNRQTGLLANRNFSLWDYSDMSDSRVFWGKNYITLTQDANKTCAFKVGYNNEAGWGAYFNKGQVFLKFFDPEADGLYPDNGCCYETYTNGVMLEVETLGELVILAPGEVVTHTEEWEIHVEDKIPSNDEKEIDAVISKYVR